MTTTWTTYGTYGSAADITTPDALVAVAYIRRSTGLPVRDSAGEVMYDDVLMTWSAVLDAERGRVAADTPVIIALMTRDGDVIDDGLMEAVAPAM